MCQRRARTRKRPQRASLASPMRWSCGRRSMTEVRSCHLHHRPVPPCRALMVLRACACLLTAAAYAKKDALGEADDAKHEVGATDAANAEALEGMSAEDLVTNWSACLHACCLTSFFLTGGLLPSHCLRRTSDLVPMTWQVGVHLVVHRQAVAALDHRALGQRDCRPRARPQAAPHPRARLRQRHARHLFEPREPARPLDPS